jgi:hypothetical protein
MLLGLKLDSRFKLHLRNNTNERPNITEEIPPLPKGKSAVDVLADILRYLFTCSSDYIQDTDVNGGELWLTLKDVIHFVLSHPNGWEGLQQDRLREAAVLAGLIPQDHSGYSRLLFVTKGEASLHFAVQNGLPSGVIEVCFSDRPSLRNAHLINAEAGGCCHCGCRWWHHRHQCLPTTSTKRDVQRNLCSSMYVDSLFRRYSPMLSILGHFHGSTFVTVNVRKWLCSASF